MNSEIITDEFELFGIRFENVRGFENAYLPLEPNKTLLVGRNHAGKTSALLLLSWVLNDADPERLSKSDYLTDDERKTLLPARSARNRARRITLEVRIRDGRRSRRFECDKRGIAKLRIGFRVSGERPYAFIQIGEPTRESGDESHSAAVALLEEIQNRYMFIHVPSARDAASTQFQKRFHDLFKQRLSRSLLHPGTPAGTTRERREFVRTAQSLNSISVGQIKPILDQVKNALPRGLMDSSIVNFGQNSDEELLNWIVNQINMSIVTGTHDSSGVAPTSVGSGLQSILDIAAASVFFSEEAKTIIAAIEEPEAFLHPSIQRMVARELLSGEYSYKTIISTHSPVLVEEARFSDIVLAANRNFVLPTKSQEEKEERIRSNLLSGYGAEMVFASAVLFVEGEGDRAYFEGIRRRLARVDESGLLDQLFVVPVGGSSSFGPWIRLIRSLNGRSDSIIEFLVAPDGDVTQDIHTAFTTSGISLPSEALSATTNARQQFSEGNYEGWLRELGVANTVFAAQSSGFPLMFLDGDLERTMLSNASESFCSVIADQIGLKFQDKSSFLKKLGSKTVDGHGSNESIKSEWIRSEISELIPQNQISERTIQVMSSALRSLMPENKVRTLFEKI